mgnify:CR=1 FL=1
MLQDNGQYKRYKQAADTHQHVAQALAGLSPEEVDHSAHRHADGDVGTTTQVVEAKSSINTEIKKMS